MQAALCTLRHRKHEPVTRAYEAMAAAFANLAASGKKLRVDAGGKVDDLTTLKRNAGAAHLLKTQAIAFGHELPRIGGPVDAVMGRHRG